MPDSRVAALIADRVRALRAEGDETDLSVRGLGRRCGLSATTVSKIMNGGIRRLHESTLTRIAGGLGIDRDLLERASLADAGFVQAASGSSVAEVLEQVRGLSRRDRATLLIELGRMQQEEAAEQEMRDAATSAE